MSEEKRAYDRRDGMVSVYMALVAWYVDARASREGGYSRDRQTRDRGRGDALVQAAMVAYGEDVEAAELRVAEDVAERIAARSGG